MAVYVVLLFNLKDAVVVNADTIDAQDRDDARSQAERLLRDNQDADGYEIWLDGVKIGDGYPAPGNRQN